MSARLDKSLDEIISTQRRTSTRGRGRRPRRGVSIDKAAVAAPVGGVKKNSKQAKSGVKAIPTGPSGNGEGKIIVSNFPRDVSEQMLKDYFRGVIGHVKKCEISYGPRGESRGIANVIFFNSSHAADAVKRCNGLKIDSNVIKVELVLDANRASALPAPKGLSERITQPKAQPKSAAATKTTTAGRGGKAGRGRGGKAGRTARPAKKTAEELDSEMADYWQSGATSAETEGGANGAAQPAANGDANMDDEIL